MVPEQVALSLQVQKRVFCVVLISISVPDEPSSSVLLRMTARGCSSPEPSLKTSIQPKSCGHPLKANRTDKLLSPLLKITGFRIQISQPYEGYEQMVFNGPVKTTTSSRPLVLRRPQDPTCPLLDRDGLTG